MWKVSGHFAVMEKRDSESKCVVRRREGEVLRESRQEWCGEAWLGRVLVQGHGISQVTEAFQ